MAFSKSIKQNFPGFGSPSNYGYVTEALTGTATMTIANTTTTPSTSGIPFNSNGGPAPSMGKYRFRLTAPNAATTCQLTVQVYDGTNTVVVAQYPASAAGTVLDVSGEFTTDLLITQVQFVATLGGGTTTGTAEAEVAMT